MISKNKFEKSFKQCVVHTILYSASADIFHVIYFSSGIIPCRETLMLEDSMQTETKREYS